MSTVVAVVIAAVIGPCLLSWFNARQRRRERREDWERQDEVAAKAVIVAKRVEVVAQRAESAVESAQQTQHAIVEQGTATAHKLEAHSEALEVIHSLVNSDMTAAQKYAYTANLRTLALLEKFAPDAPETAEMRDLVEEQRAALVDRQTATSLADAIAERHAAISEPPEG